MTGTDQPGSRPLIALVAAPGEGRALLRLVSELERYVDVRSRGRCQREPDALLVSESAVARVGAVSRRSATATSGAVQVGDSRIAVPEGDEAVGARAVLVALFGDSFPVDPVERLNFRLDELGATPAMRARMTTALAPLQAPPIPGVLS